MRMGGGAGGGGGGEKPCDFQFGTFIGRFPRRHGKRGSDSVKT